MPRKSSVDKLPPVIKAAIAGLLKDGRLTLDQIVGQIRGEFPDEPELPSRSAIGRYKQSMDQIGKHLRESREVASVWAERLGKEPEGDVAKLVMELLRTLAFDVTLSMHEGEEPVKAGDLNKLALAMQRLESAGKWNIEREDKMRTAARESAAKVAGAEAKKAGLSEISINRIRERIIMGMSG